MPAAPAPFAALSTAQKPPNSYNRHIMKRFFGEENSVRYIILRNVFTYFNLICLILAVMLIAVGDYKELSFLAVVIANMLIGIIQQLNAKRTLDRLNLMARVEYRVLRQGRQLSLPPEELCRGDVILLQGGQQVPADANVISGRVMVNEALLTGESDELEKSAGTRLMSGSFIISGSCQARAEHVGENAYIARLTQKAKQIKERKSEMVTAIDRIVGLAGIAIIPIGALLLWEAVWVNGLSPQEGIVSMVGAVIGLIPEGLYLLLTIALALSAARLAMNQVMLHDMRSTESLARADVLCIDKTGTITDNEMTVDEIFFMEGLTDEALKNELTDMLGSYVATVEGSNITAKALRAYFPNARKLRAVSTSEFSSTTKYSEVVTEEGVWRLGAPAFILDEETMASCMEAVSRRTNAGRRVLVLAEKSGDIFRPLLFVSLLNGLRPNAAETFRYLAMQEVRILVISGDDPQTVSSVAQRVGIPGAERYVDASKITNGIALREAVKRYTVFGRVRPEQKKDIVTALKDDGLRVAMTGDGVNDILAMKEADCSIAIGSGSEAARQVAQIVLLDSDFSHMKEIIGEGRRVVNNLTRSATLFLYKNIFSLLLAIFSIVSIMTYPLKPSQITLVSMFNIGLPGFLLALENNEKKQKDRFLSVTLKRSVPAALTSFFSIAALVVFGQVFSISASDIGVASCFLLALVGFMILWKICSPTNRFRRLVFIICVAGFALGAYFFAPLFSISYVSGPCLMLAAVFAIAQEAVMRWLTFAVDRIWK